VEIMLRVRPDDELLEVGDAVGEQRVHHHDEPAVELLLVTADEVLSRVALGVLRVEERRLLGEGGYGWRRWVGKANGFPLRAAAAPARTCRARSTLLSLLVTFGGVARAGAAALLFMLLVIGLSAGFQEGM
jgi:hypothetical protein